MIRMELDGYDRVTAAVDRCVDEARGEARGWLKDMGYAMSGTAGSRIRQKTANRLHMYPSVRQIGDDVRLHIQFNTSKLGARKLARRSLAEATRSIWNRWTAQL